MPAHHAEKLIELSKKGQKLSAKDRRHCVAYYMGMSSGLTNNELGELFQVSERMIRIDKKTVKEERVKLLKEEDIGLVIADIALTLERQMRDIETSKAKCSMGTIPYLKHCEAIHAIQLRTVKALQELGHYPKNLGNLIIEKFEYRADVSKDGSVLTRPVNMEFEDAEFTEVQTVQAQLPAPVEDIPTEPVE